MRKGQVMHMDIGGFLLMLLGLVVLYFVVISTGWRNPTSSWGKICMGLTPKIIADAINSRHASAPTPTDAPAMSVSPPAMPTAREEIAAAGKAGSFLNIDGSDEQVQGSVMLLELKFFGTDKNDKVHVDPQSGDRLREFRALSLAGNQLLVEHPSGEGRPLKFFLYDDKSDEVPLGFAEYVKGTKEEPGPGKRFAESDQRADVEMDALEKSWKLQDIIWVDVELGSGRFFVEDGARVVMLLARNEDEWLLWADLRSGGGSDVLWVGRQFDPDVEIEVV